MRYFFPVILLVVLVVSCNKETVKPVNTETKDSVQILYSKTHCYGRCPVYKMTINNNGNVIFEGEANVDKIGKYSLQLSPAEMDTLILEFGKAHFFELEDRYYKDLSDFPTTFITFTQGEKTKKITDYYGAPKRLKVLEAKIEEIVEKDGWTKIE